jgi:hypothetical protein
MKKIVMLVVIVANVMVLQAQNKTANSLEYKTAVGLRLGAGGGLNLKTFLDKKNALEFLGFFDSDGVRIVGLYEIHGDLSTEGNLKWYLGAGGNIGLYKAATVFGVTGVVGIDYKFKELPLNVAIDWQPTIQTKNGFAGDWVTLAVRYTL